MNEYITRGEAMWLMVSWYIAVLVVYFWVLYLLNKRQVNKNLEKKAKQGAKHVNSSTRSRFHR